MKVDPKRRVLGKGLSSLIPEAPAGSGAAVVAEPARPAVATGKPLELPLDAIKPNPRQPRTVFDEAEIDSLAESIKASGVLQPLVVRVERNGSYTLVAGERRLRAARKAGLATVPVVTREVADDRLLEYALIENLQRDDLGPLETAAAFRTLVREFGLTQAEVAERVGKPRSTVANFLRLLDLPEPVRTLLGDGQLEMGHARALAGIDDAELQVRLAAQCAKARWSVREIEQRLRRALTQPAPAEAEKGTDPNVAAAEKTLSRALGAIVSIHQVRGGKGRIEIRFADDEDLDRLYRSLLRAGNAPVH